MTTNPKALAAISSDDVTRAMRTFELHAGPARLRYPEAQKWHLRDIMAMRQVLEEFAARRTALAAARQEGGER